MHYSFIGIVLDQVQYSDSSTIVKLLSREMGLQSVLAKGLKGKRGKSIRPLLGKMSIVEVEAFKRKDNELGVLKSARSAAVQLAPLDVKRIAISLFVNEVLCRTVKEGHEDPELFDLVVELLKTLGQSDHYADLHLIFMLKLTKTFGAQPEIPTNPPRYFDLLEGSPNNSTPSHGHFVEGRMCTLFLKCLGTDLAMDARLGIDNNERRALLEKILEYYRLQLDEKLDLRSHKILHTVLE